MEIRLADQRIFALNETLSVDQARQRAMDKRTNAVTGGLGGLLQRPKVEEIELTGSQKRFEPFWHVAASARYVYDRARKYNVPVTGAEVESVTLQTEKFAVADMGKAGRLFTINVMEHCREELKQEVFADGQTGNPLADAAGLVKSAKIEISDPAMLAADETIVVPPETRASFVVRQLMNQMMKPVQADAVHEEIISLETIDLYYRPVWAFEFLWKPKDKRGVLEFDAVTGQTRSGQSLIAQAGRMLSRDTLFDIGADTIGMLIPGGNLAVKIAKIALDSKK